MTVRRGAECSDVTRRNMTWRHSPRLSARMTATTSTKPACETSRDVKPVTELSSSTFAARRGRPDLEKTVASARSRKPAAARARRSHEEPNAPAPRAGRATSAPKRYTLYLSEDLLDAARVALGATSEVDAVRRALVACIEHTQFREAVLEGYAELARGTWFDDSDVSACGLDA